MLFVSQQRSVFLVVFLVPAVVDLCRLRSHRRIDHDRQHRYTLGLFKLSDQVQYLLRPAYCKSRNKDRPAALYRLIDDRGHLVVGRDLSMKTVAVGRLDH